MAISREIAVHSIYDMSSLYQNQVVILCFPTLSFRFWERVLVQIAPVPGHCFLLGTDKKSFYSELRSFYNVQ